MIDLVTGPIDMVALSAAVEDPGAGAIVTFAGTTRNETRGKPVVSLTYEAYGDMARAKLVEVAEAARERFDVRKVAVVHRVATLEIGEISVGIAVSAAHRPAAFDACRYVIEAIKADVPIWKKETFVDGSAEWVRCDGCAGGAG
jgi:molybdopterin synthase catalytic subunit